MKSKAVLLVWSLVTTISVSAQMTEKQKINEVLDNWHLAAANADFDAYFGLMTKDAVFIGTDAMDTRQNDEFNTFSKPYFDRGKALRTTPVQQM